MPGSGVPMAKCQGCQLFPETLPAWPACPPTALMPQSCHLLPWGGEGKGEAGLRGPLLIRGRCLPPCSLPESQGYSRLASRAALENSQLTWGGRVRRLTPPFSPGIR